MFQQFQHIASSKHAKENQFVIIGAGTHCDFKESSEDFMVGERNMGNASRSYTDVQLRWFDYWLKDDISALASMPKTQHYLMGKNEWRSSDVRPLHNTSYQPWYLHSQDNAQSRLGDGKLSIDKSNSSNNSNTFIYDPAEPVPSLGGHTCCTGSNKEAGAYDQSDIQLRKDILVYSSDILNESMEVTGPLKAVLYVSSSAIDTDFTVKLVDVYPDGRAFNIQEA